MTDIVEKLRRGILLNGPLLKTSTLDVEVVMFEAADEIERLREVVQEVASRTIIPETIPVGTRSPLSRDYDLLVRMARNALGEKDD